MMRRALSSNRSNIAQHSNPNEKATPTWRRSREICALRVELHRDVHLHVASEMKFRAVIGRGLEIHARVVGHSPLLDRNSAPVLVNSAICILIVNDDHRVLARRKIGHLE